MINVNIYQGGWDEDTVVLERKRVVEVMLQSKMLLLGGALFFSWI